MFISGLGVQNWRNFTKFEVELGKIVYLIGPNASGKSNFLDIFRFLRDIANPDGGGLQKAVKSRGGMGKIRCLAARQYPEIKIHISFKKDLDSTSTDWEYILVFGGRANKDATISSEIVKCGKNIIVERPNKDDESDPHRLTQTFLEQVNSNKEFRTIVDFLNETLYLHLVPQLLKYGDQLSTQILENDPFGQGFLREIAKTASNVRKSRLNRIQKALKVAIPQFEELKFERDKIDGSPHLLALYSHWRSKGSWQREDQFSDGTLRIISLLWILMTSNQLVLLEEPELSLHTKIVEQIPSLLYQARASRKTTESQVFVTTHSEALLGNPGIAGNILILKPGEKGEATQILPPSEEDMLQLRSGLSPADVLLPQTGSVVGEILV